VLTGDRPAGASYTRSGGASFRGLLGVPVADGIFLTVQPGFASRGTGVAYAVRGESEPRDSLDLAIAYVSVAVGVRVVPSNGRFFVTSSLDLGYLIGAEFDDASGPVEVEESLHELDVGVGLAVGARMSVGRPDLAFEVGYGQSLRNLTDESRQAPEWDFPPRFKMRGFHFSAGVQIVVGGEP
jgi:hypothetical protein